MRWEEVCSTVLTRPQNCLATSRFLVRQGFSRLNSQYSPVYTSRKTNFAEIHRFYENAILPNSYGRLVPHFRRLCVNPTEKNKPKLKNLAQTSFTSPHTNSILVINTSLLIMFVYTTYQRRKKNQKY